MCHRRRLHRLCRLCRIGFVIVKFCWAKTQKSNNRERPRELYACTQLLARLSHRLRYIRNRNRCSLLRYTFSVQYYYCYCYACILLVSINRLQIWSLDDIAPSSHAPYRVYVCLCIHVLLQNALSTMPFCFSFVCLFKYAI